MPATLYLHHHQGLCDGCLSVPLVALDVVDGGRRNFCRLVSGGSGGGGAFGQPHGGGAVRHGLRKSLVSSAAHRNCRGRTRCHGYEAGGAGRRRHPHPHLIVCIRDDVTSEEGTDAPRCLSPCAVVRGDKCGDPLTAWVHVAMAWAGTAAEKEAVFAQQQIPGVSGA
ncbi:hypothetical protein I4F81_001208 [Pyropia yezoensis]|uniref:Uncharacterized protein n=1 Tax=Pyropia yezoensis TaxID=2788 RepID=A0ACC3BLB2_PYRYE|nr:hypothetical protein I4F81_001208 [Neopyropia yezoensis]